MLRICQVELIRFHLARDSGALLPAWNPETRLAHRSGPKKPDAAVLLVPHVCASCGGQTRSSGVCVPTTDCDSALTGGEVCGEKGEEKGEVSIEQVGETVEVSESYSGENVDTTGEVVGDCQVGQDQVSTSSSAVVGFLFFRSFNSNSAEVHYIIQGRCLLVKVAFDHFTVVFINIC